MLEFLKPFIHIIVTTKKTTFNKNQLFIDEWENKIKRTHKLTQENL